MTKKELNSYSNRELYEIKKHYNNGELYEFLLENVFGINYEDMTLDLSSVSYVDLYKEKLYCSTYSYKISRTIPSEICKYLRDILMENIS